MFNCFSEEFQHQIVLASNNFSILLFQQIPVLTLSCFSIFQQILAIFSIFQHINVLAPQFQQDCVLIILAFSCFSKLLFQHFLVLASFSIFKQTRAVFSKFQQILALFSIKIFSTLLFQQDCVLASVFQHVLTLIRFLA